MKNKILSLFICNSNKKLGIDNHYHTVYFIQFENGYFYIGKRSTLNIDNDDYFCSGYMAQELKNNNVKYTREIISYLNSNEEAIELETKILLIKEIYENEFCLNCTQNSPPSSYGTIIVSRNNKFKMIKESLLNLFLNKGWKREGVRRIWIYKDKKHKFILPSELEIYVKNDWIVGNVFAQDRLFIIKNSKRKFIKKDELEFYINDGWSVKHTHIDTQVLEKDNQKFFIHKDLVDDFLSKGFIKSSTVKELIWIKKETQHKRVSKEKLESYINLGWKIGSNKTGQVYVTNGVEEKRIEKTEIKNLCVDWYVGRSKKVYLNNGMIECRVSINNQKLIDDYIQKGYVVGSLRKTSSVIVIKNNEKRYISKKSIQSYLKRNWQILECSYQIKSDDISQNNNKGDYYEIINDFIDR